MTPSTSAEFAMVLSRCFRVLALALWVVGLLAGLPDSTAFAGTQESARVALHLKAHTTKSSSVCTTWSPNAQNLPCSRYVTTGNIGQGYDVYVVAGRGDPGAGIAGVQFTVHYNNLAGAGVEVYDWTLCADGQYPTAGTYGDWPSSGSANKIGWASAGNCQRTAVGNEGVHAVAGVFYVYAYSAGGLTLSSPPPGFSIWDCQGTATIVDQVSPSVVFSSVGGMEGQNPCEGVGCGVSPTSVNFGSHPSGAVRDTTFTIRNVGVLAIGGNWSVSGTAFSLLSAPSAPIAPGQTGTITLRFAPTAVGKHKGTLSSDGPCWTSIALVGTATMPCSFDRTSLTFPPLLINDAQAQYVTLTNHQYVRLQETIRVTGNGFSLGLADGAVDLAPGESMSIPVVFRPPEAGDYAGTLTAGTGCAGVALYGKGVPPCELDQSVFRYGTVVLGAYEDREFVLTYHGHQIFHGQIVVTGSCFHAVEGGAPFTLEAGASHRFTMRFQPDGVGPTTATVSVGSPCPILGLTGVGRAPILACAVAPSADENLGFVPVGGYRTMTFQLSSTGEGPVEVQLSEEGLRPDFSLPDGEGTIIVPAGSTHDVRIRYAPTAMGVHVATLATGSECGSIRVSGYATGCRILPGHDLSFGLLQVGTSRTQSFRIVGTSEGPMPLTLDGSGLQPNFSLPRGEGPFTVSPGDTLEIPVRYNPYTTGAHSGALLAGLPCGELIVEGRAQARPVECFVDQPELDFGDVPIGYSLDLRFNLINYTGARTEGEVTGGEPGFSLVGNTRYDLGWGDSLSVTVRFAPKAAGPRRTHFHVGGACDVWVEATGRGIIPPDTSRVRPRIRSASRPDDPVQRLTYEVFATAGVTIVVFDIVGHELARFDEGARTSGSYEVSWDAGLRPGGIYFARITAGQATFTRRLLLLR